MRIYFWILLLGVLSGCSTTPTESNLPLLQAARIQKISNWISVHQGKIRLLYFWVSYYRDCLSDLLILKQLETVFSDKDIALLTINLDPHGIATVRTLIEQYQLKFPVLLGGEEIRHLYQIRALPYLLVVDLQNQPLLELTGSIDLETLKQQIQSSLTSKS